MSSLRQSYSVPKVHDITFPIVNDCVETQSTVAHLLALRSSKLLAIMPPSTPVHLYAVETTLYANVIVQLKSEFAEVFCNKLGDVANFPSVTKAESLWQMSLKTHLLT